MYKRRKWVYKRNTYKRLDPLLTPTSVWAGLNFIYPLHCRGGEVRIQRTRMAVQTKYKQSHPLLILLNIWAGLSFPQLRPSTMTILVGKKVYKRVKTKCERLQPFSVLSFLWAGLLLLQPRPPTSSVLEGRVSVQNDESGCTNEIQTIGPIFSSNSVMGGAGETDLKILFRRSVNKDLNFKFRT